PLAAVRPEQHKTPTTYVVGVLSRRSPDGIRTRATALRGRRARPLHNGAVCFRRFRAGEKPYLIGMFSAKSGRSGDRSFLRAGVPGLEPRLTEPESVVLPITPYPKGYPRSGFPGRRTEEKPYPDPSSDPNPGPRESISTTSSRV